MEGAVSVVLDQVRLRGRAKITQGMMHKACGMLPWYNVSDHVPEVVVVPGVVKSLFSLGVEASRLGIRL